jgi:CubicO group peptidase (beta-lactamase class C family)
MGSPLPAGPLVDPPGQPGREGVGPAAGLTSSVEDMARFVSLQFRTGPAGGAQIHPTAVVDDGCTIGDLAVGDTVWISIVNRGGRLIHVNGQTVLQAGDEVLALADKDAELDGVFTRPEQRGE